MEGHPNDAGRSLDNWRQAMKRGCCGFSAVLLAAVLAACGGGSGGSNGSSSGNNPTGPSGRPGEPLALNPCTSAQTCGDLNSIGIWISIRNGGESDPWSFTFGEFTKTGSGNAEYGFMNVSPGEHQVSGQFSTRASFDIGFGRNRSTVPGGITPSSLQSLEGPLVRLSNTGPPCTVQYARSDATVKTFRVTFTVNSASSQGTC